MAEDASADVNTITFNVKASNDKRYVIIIADNLTVGDLKEKLSTSEYADIPADRQRLIYSGRVLKDPDLLSTYKIKDGNTVHLVKGAASNQQRNPETGGSTNSVPPNAGVPQNIAAGTGNDPLAGLTGARYAGFAQMPSADMFGGDGGMNAGNPDEMLRMLENPMFQSQMNEAMNNPQVVQMLENSPMIRDQPHMLEMIRNPEMRRLMMDPAFIRQSMRLSQMMNGGQGQGNMPAPGVTDATPRDQGQTGDAQPTTNFGAAPPNPFALFGQQNPGGSTQANPFAALLGSMPPVPPANNSGSSTTDVGTNSARSTAESAQQQQTPPNPFASMFGQPPTGSGAQGDLIGQAAQQMMQNPEMMRMAMQMMGAGAPPAGEGSGSDSAPAFNPFAMLGGGGGNASTPTPQDSRPPEEMYANQLRQLNDMGFFDFARNVRALRMAGGRVEGAVEMLLGGSV